MFLRTYTRGPLICCSLPLQAEDQTPTSSSLHIDLSPGKILNPKLLLVAVPSVCEWVVSSDGWVGILCGGPHHQCVNRVNAIWSVKQLHSVDQKRPI